MTATFRLDDVLKEKSPLDEFMRLPRTDTPPPLDTLDNLHAHTERMHHEMLVKQRHKSLSPMALVVAGNGYLVPVVADLSDKFGFSMLMRELMRKLKAERYVFFSEAWMASPTDIGPDVQSISEMPSKFEVVITSGADRNGEVKYSFLCMVRDKRGRLTELRPYDLPDDGRWRTDGMFANFLEAEHEPVTYDSVRAAMRSQHKPGRA